MTRAESTSYFDSQKGWVTDFLTGLLAIPSESGREQDAQEYLYQKLSMLDVRCEKIPISNDIRRHPDHSDPVENLDYTGRCNLLLEKAGRGGKVVAMNSHFDVVPPSPGQTDAFCPRLDAQGVMHARGACDAKGQIAVMALLAKAACELPALKNTLINHFVVEEEFGGNGTLALLQSQRGFRADALVNLEPTGLQVKTTIRGAVWFEMGFSGEAGHAGSAKNTQSAIYKAMEAIELLRNYQKELYRRSENYGLYAGLANPMPLTIGEFHAGVWPSMVPGKAHIRGVLGFLPNMDKERVMADIRALFETEAARELRRGMGLHFCYRHNATELSPEHPFALKMRSACRAHGLSGEPQAMTASTDAVFYEALGIPSLAFGPGLIEDAHSCHEKISMDEILLAAHVLYDFVKDY